MEEEEPREVLMRTADERGGETQADSMSSLGHL